MQREARRLVALAGLSMAGAVQAQLGPTEPVELPDGPAAPGFDIERFSSAGNGWFETFYVEETDALRTALDDGRLAGNTRMLVIETAGGNLALVTDQMAYHHLAQGTSEGRHWLASF
jgi:non-ribosomal peptide synthetase component F